MQQGLHAAVPRFASAPESVEQKIFAAVRDKINMSYLSGTGIREIEIEVRTLVVISFPDVLVTSHFTFGEVPDTNEWHMRVRMQDGRLVDISHD